MTKTPIRLWVGYQRLRRRFHARIRGMARSSSMVSPRRRPTAVAMAIGAPNPKVVERAYAVPIARTATLSQWA